jgi:hypothetical protein
MIKKLTKAQRKERDNLIRQTAQYRPDYTLQDLADLFGLKSRSHVYWIINKPYAGGK